MVATFSTLSFDGALVGINSGWNEVLSLRSEIHLTKLRRGEGVGGTTRSLFTASLLRQSGGELAERRPTGRLLSILGDSPISYGGRPMRQPVRSGSCNEGGFATMLAG